MTPFKVLSFACWLIASLAFVGFVLCLVGALASCKPSRTAAEAESCRARVDAQFTPVLVGEALANCKHGGTIAQCLSPASIAAYNEAVKACREAQ